MMSMRVDQTYHIQGAALRRLGNIKASLNERAVIGGRGEGSHASGVDEPNERALAANGLPHEATAANGVLNID